MLSKIVYIAHHPVFGGTPQRSTWRHNTDTIYIF